MMMSPEGYIEWNIKGKSKRHVLAEIRHLKAKIARLEKSIQNPNLKVVRRPSPDVQLQINKEYLELAEKYLKESF